MDVNSLHAAVASAFLRDSFPAGFEKASCHIVRTIWEEPFHMELRTLSGQQLSRNCGPQSLNHKEMNPADNHVRSEVNPSPVQPPDETPANTLSAALQRVQLSCAPRNCEIIVCVLLSH